MNKFMTIFGVIACMVMFSGCEELDKLKDDLSGDDTASDGLDLGSVVWLDQDVSGWPATASMSASVGGGAVNVPYDKANVWPGITAGGAAVNANVWIFVNQGGTWYGATWEWLRVGQTSKSVASVSGSHIKKSPLENFHPVSGETYGFMVSGLVRLSASNIKERSNVSMVTWP
jgi:hypothetical protein